MKKNGSFALWLKRIAMILVVLTPLVAGGLWINDTTNRALADNIELKIKNELEEKFVGDDQFCEFKNQFNTFRTNQEKRFDKIDNDLDRILDEIIELAGR